MANCKGGLIEVVLSFWRTAQQQQHQLYLYPQLIYMIQKNNLNMERLQAAHNNH